MLLPGFEYQRPDTVTEAVELLSSTRNARVLAGGQTLLNALKHRIVHPDLLVDVSRIETLRTIEVRGDGTVQIGAAVTYDEIADSDLVYECHRVIAAMSSRLVDRQVRSRGTIGGNVCLADPTSNFPPLLLALGARLRIRSGGGFRDVPSDEFFIAPYMTAVEPGELLETVMIPPLGPGDGVGYESLQVGTDSWALARAAALVRCEGTILAARVALGCGPVPVRQPAMENALVGQSPEPDVVAGAAELAGEAFDPPSDAHASAEFRTAMAKVMARRAVTAATASHLEA